MRFVLKSAGILHMESIPNATVTFDVQDLAYDPSLHPSLRYLSGETEEIRNFVLNSPGVREVIVRLAALMEEISDMSIRPGVEEISLLVYCRGGRHRSRVIIDEVAKILKCYFDYVEVEHMHAHLPVVEH